MVRKADASSNLLQPSKSCLFDPTEGLGIISVGLLKARRGSDMLVVRIVPHPKGRPVAVCLLTALTTAGLVAQWVYGSRHEFSEEAMAQWFEWFSYDPYRPTVSGLFASLLVHLDGWHWLGNLLGLWLFGWWVEAEGKGWRFLLAGLGVHWLSLQALPFLAQWLPVDATQPLAGLSTLTAFAMGLYWVRFRHCLMVFEWTREKGFPFAVPLRWLIGFWLVVQGGVLAYQLWHVSIEGAVVAHWLSFLMGSCCAFALGWHSRAKGDLWQQQAFFAEQRGDWHNAALLWQRFARQNPNDPKGWLSTAFALLQQGNLPAAEQALRQALSVWFWDDESVERACQLAMLPSLRQCDPELWMALAEQLERHRCYWLALLLFQQAAEVTEFKRAPQALLKVVELHWRLGNEVRAMQALHRFWLAYAQTPWRQGAENLLTQLRQRGERR